MACNSIRERNVFERIKANDPQVRAIVSSGYFNDPVMAEHQKHSFSGVVAKPYRLAELSDVLHKVIGTKVHGSKE